MAKKSASIAVVMGVDDGYTEALKKASDPNMTTKNNPLAQPKCEGCNPSILDRNMERLHEDAHMRRNPTHGGVYSAIMDNRYGG